MNSLTPPPYAAPVAQLGQWTILEDMEIGDIDGDGRKSTWWAFNGRDNHLIDVSPYDAPPSRELVEALEYLGWPTRSDFGQVWPLQPDQVLARYWRARALAAEARLEAAE